MMQCLDICLGQVGGLMLRRRPIAIRAFVPCCTQDVALPDIFHAQSALGFCTDAYCKNETLQAADHMLTSSYYEVNAQKCF